MPLRVPIQRGYSYPHLPMFYPQLIHMACEDHSVEKTPGRKFWTAPYRQVILNIRRPYGCPHI